MAWARVDDEFDENDKIILLSHAEFRLYVCSISATHRWKSKGELTKGRAEALARKHRVPLKAIQGLLNSGRWEINGENYFVHDIHKYESNYDSEERSRSGKKGAAARWESIANSHKEPLAEPRLNMARAQTRVGSPKPVPNPIPVPVNETPTESLLSSEPTTRKKKHFTDDNIADLIELWNECAKDSKLPKVVLTPKAGDDRYRLMAKVVGDTEHSAEKHEEIFGAICAYHADPPIDRKGKPYGIDTFCVHYHKWVDAAAQREAELLPV